MHILIIACPKLPHTCKNLFVILFFLVDVSWVTRYVFADTSVPPRFHMYVCIGRKGLATRRKGRIHTTAHNGGLVITSYARVTIRYRPGQTCLCEINYLES